MKKLISFSLIALVGVSLLFSGILPAKADEARVIKHNFIAYTASTAVAQSRVIFRISGVATGSPGVYGIYNSATLGGTAVTACATEGGAATSGNPLNGGIIDFGPDGLILDTGASIVVSSATVVIEYI